MSIENGSEKEGQILESAQAEFDADTKAGNATGKAPRKLAGAALKAVQAKQEREAAAKAEARPAAEEKPKRKAPARKSVTDEERLAAEAKQLAGTVSEKMADDPEGKAFKQAKGTKKEVKPTKTTPKKNETKKVLADKPVTAPLTGSFDPATLKTADGKWKSASAMFKGLLWEGKHKDDAKLFAAVQKEFDLSDDKIGYVAWNRGWFRRQGVELKA